MNRAMIIITSQAERDKATRWAQGVSVGTRIEFKEPKRTLPQNDRFWAMLTDIAGQMKERGRDYDPSQWKVIFMAAFGHEVKFLPSLDQKTFIPVGHSSSDLSVREMSDLMEFMSAWAAENDIHLNDNPDGADPVEGNSSTLDTASAGEDAASPKPSPAPFLVRFARDVFALAINQETTGAAFASVMKRWHSEIEKLSADDQEKAKQIGASAKRLFSDAALYEGLVEHYADMLAVEPKELMAKS